MKKKKKDNQANIKKEGKGGQLFQELGALGKATASPTSWFGQRETQRRGEQQPYPAKSAGPGRGHRVTTWRKTGQGCLVAWEGQRRRP